jgi:hypothetical protein
MGGVGTSILGRPRHLPRDRRASHHPTSDSPLNCEEPDMLTAAMPPLRWYYGGMADEVKLTVRIPRDMHERIKALASEDRRSLNSELIWLLESAVEIEERGGRT